jgi:hypothetical protein
VPFHEQRWPLEACSDRRAYSVDRIDTKEMVYTNKATGERSAVTRVPDDYRLP